MRKWLTVIGVGDDGISGLTPAARALLASAEIVVGSERLLANLDGAAAERHLWQAPLAGMIEAILGWRGRRVIVLASGDPMHYGIGATMARHLPREEMTVIPAPSAFSLAAARLGWALQELEMVSLHGRPADLIVPLIQPRAKILALTGGANTVREVAARLVARGFGPSRLIVLEHMASAKERIVETTAVRCAPLSFAEFNTLAIECIAEPGARILPRVPGLPDDAFAHDGQLTKREVRAPALAALAPTPGALLWDVGAGCGSIAIEWMRAASGTRAIAFEHKPERLRLIAENALALGTPELKIVAGRVPASLAGQPGPDAVFLGGAVSDPDVFGVCWAALPTGGRMVADAATLESEVALIARYRLHGGELLRIDVAQVTTLGQRHVFRPRLPITQWRVSKP